MSNLTITHFIELIIGVSVLTTKPVDQVSQKNAYF
jgi:hypothetical protein